MTDHSTRDQGGSELERLRQRVVDLECELGRRDALAEEIGATHEQLLASVLGTDDGLFHWSDLSRREVWWSPRFFALLGYADGELQPTVERWLEMVHPEDRDWVARRIAEVGDGGAVFDAECRVRRKDGEYRWFRTRGRSFAGGDGALSGVAGSVRDITERKHAEAELLTVRTILEEAERIGSIGSWEWNRVTGRKWLSPQLCAIYGCDPADGLPGLDNVHPDDRERVRQALEAAWESGCYDETFRITRDCDGVERTIHGMAEVELDRDGRPVRMLGVARDVTDEHVVAQQLRETAEILSEAQEVAGLGSYLWDLRDDSLTWSSNMYRIAGLDEATFDGTLTDVSLSIIHADDQERIAAEVEAMVVQGETWPMEFRIVRPDGEERLLQSRSRFIKDNAGQPITCVGVHYDITAQERAKAAQVRSEIRFAQVVQNLADPVFAHGLDGRFRIVNRAACESLGYSHEELLNMTVDDVDPDATGRGDPDRWTRLAKGIPMTLEVRHQRRDGTIFQVEVRLTKIELDGEPIVFAVARNVSARIRADMALRSSRYQLEVSNRIATCFLTEDDDTAFADALEVVLEALESPLGFVGFIDEEGRLVCPSMTRGAWDQCEVAGKSVVFEPSVWGGLWGRSLLERRSLVANDGLEPPEGHVPLTSALAVPVLDGGRLLGQLAVANREDGYGEREVELLESVAERVAPILKARQQRHAAEAHQAVLEAQLREAQKLEAVGVLAGGIAHDFNNILQAIYGHAEFALLRAPQSGTHRHLEQICSSAERAAGLVRQLLAFGRKQILRTAPLDLNELVVTAVGPLQEAVGDNIRLEAETARDLPLVQADRNQIAEVLSQLVENASDAIFSTGTITLETSEGEFDEGSRERYGIAEDRQLVRLTVRDTGIGMDSDTLSRVFEPFFSTKTVGRGPGLGLAMAYGIVRQHGGVLLASSVPGSGSEFAVFLPVALSVGS